MVKSSRSDRDQVIMSPHAPWRRPQAPPERVTAAMRSPKLHCCIDRPLPSAIPQVAEPEGPVVYLPQVPVLAPGSCEEHQLRFGAGGNTLLGLGIPKTVGRGLLFFAVRLRKSHKGRPAQVNEVNFSQLFACFPPRASAWGVFYVSTPGRAGSTGYQIYTPEGVLWQRRLRFPQ